MNNDERLQHLMKTKQALQAQNMKLFQNGANWSTSAELRRVNEELGRVNKEIAQLQSKAKPYHQYTFNKSQVFQLFGPPSAAPKRTGSRSAPRPGVTAPTTALAEINGLIGVGAVKEFVNALHAQVTVNQKRQALGMKVHHRTLHMVFAGNPGTGKTTVARMVARLLKELGILESGHLVEVDRAGLVGGYLGQTALKTQQTIKRALGGVLFVDEAYALVQGADDSYGLEALDVLVKATEDYRDRLVVILAGYPAEMEMLLAANPGLRSRFANYVLFEDYSAEELAQIAVQMFAERDLVLTPKASLQLSRSCALAGPSSTSGNARYVRNIVEQVELKQAMRLARIANVTRDDLQTLIEDDFV